MAEETNQEKGTEVQPQSIKDLKPKMKLTGTVTRVELYGAFVDIGVGRDGLVHISQLKKERVNRVADVVSEGDEVTVWVQRIDPKRNRISLTMVEPPERTMAELEPGTQLTGTVRRLERYGAFVDVGVERDGLVHVSELAPGYVKDPSEYVSVGEEVEVRVVSVDLKKNQIELSMKDLPSDQMADVEAEEEEVPTAFEVALKEAMAQAETEEESMQKGRHKRQKGPDDELADILSRTLEISSKD